VWEVLCRGGGGDGGGYDGIDVCEEGSEGCDRVEGEKEGRVRLLTYVHPVSRLYHSVFVACHTWS